MYTLSVDSRTASQLLDLNRRFYEHFGADFASTRQRIQNGVRRVFDALPDAGDWLDLGCGSGALALEWLKARRCARYLGLDFSTALLSAARQAVAILPDVHEVSDCSPVSFRQASLADPGWARDLEQGSFYGVLAFAVLHHLPSRALRERVLRQVHSLLAPGGTFIHSEWQFQNSAKLWDRRLPWSTVGLAEEDLEPGDTLLDWRSRQQRGGVQVYAGGQAQPQVGLRYVHLFSRAELAELARATGFEIVEEFESDGQGGNLSLYQVWKARPAG